MLPKHTTALPRGQAGFTLIELSIVLVIIGLLIGGILKGQEMINGTRVKTQVAQIDSLRAAINSFQDRYLGLPGDITAPAPLTDATHAGTADNGLIGADAGVAAAAAISAAPADEPSMALTNLVQANFLGGVIDGNSTTVLSRLPGKLSGVSVAIGNITLPDGNSYNAFRIAGGNGYAATATIGAATAAEIDRKYDDNAANSGFIQDQGNASCAAVATGVYAATDGADCILHFRFQ